MMRRHGAADTDMLGSAPAGGRASTRAAVARLGQGRRVRRPARQGHGDVREMARAMSVQMNIMDRVAAVDAAGRDLVAVLRPRREGVQAFGGPRPSAAWKSSILTNSLAANDVPLVHIGYARYRVGLVRAGVDALRAQSGRPAPRRMGCASRRCPMAASTPRRR